MSDPSEVNASQSSKPTHICKMCGATSTPTQGLGAGCFIVSIVAGLLSVFLGYCLQDLDLLCYIVGGIAIIGPFFDFFSTDVFCPHCKNKNCLIPLDSPEGKDILAKYRMNNR